MDTLWLAFEDTFALMLTSVPRLLAACIVLIVTFVTARWVADWAVRTLLRTQAPKNAIGALSAIARLGVLALGSLIVLQVLGLSQAVFNAIASLGVVGLIVSFALQDITKQFASGVLLLLGRPFEIGDYIKIGSYEGRVVELQLRVTVLCSDDGEEVLIPNADVYTSAVVNTSRARARRYSFELKVPASTQNEALRERLRTTIAAVPGVAAEPPPEVTVASIDSETVSLIARYWIASTTANPQTVVSSVLAAVHAVRTEMTTIQSSP